MRRRLLLVPLLVLALPLGGCVASMAAGAIGAAVKSSQPKRGPYQPDAAVRLGASQACEAHAAQFGTVTIIDTEQRSASRAVVYGTVTDPNQRRSFECRFDSKVVGFKLRPI